MRSRLGACAVLMAVALGPIVVDLGASEQTWETATRYSEFVYPPEEIELNFSHRLHLAADMVCVDCHRDAKDSVRAADRLLPTMEQCLECHALSPSEQSTRRAAECSTCHPIFERVAPSLPAGIEVLDETTFRSVINPPPRPYLPTPRLEFSHRLHSDHPCVDCHAGVVTADLATRAHLPTMGECIECHQNNGVAAGVRPGTCSMCHVSRPDGRILTKIDDETLVPSGRFRADDHRFDFVDNHGQIGRTDSDYCQSCHTEDECADCHNGVVKPIEIHPPNYLTTHSMDAIQSPGDCGSCHVAQDFCISCHNQMNVGEASRPPIGTAFHPMGFVDDVASPWFHGPAAQRNITACVSCHEESSCVGCHAGINPHGPDFSATCGPMMSRNRTACAACHRDLDALEAQCE